MTGRILRHCILPPLGIFELQLQAQGFPGGLVGKESTCNAGAVGSIPWSGRSFGGGHGNPLQYSCLENPMERGAWQAIVHGVTESDVTEVT